MAGLVLGCLLLSLWSSPSRSGQAIDVYVAYSSKNKAQKDRFLNALDTADNAIEYRVYNTDFIAVMDYSGRQKALAKLEQAGTVVVLGERPTEYLKGSELSCNLVLVESTTTEIKSSQSIVHVVSSEFEAGPDCVVEKIQSDHVWQFPPKSNALVWVVEGDEAKHYQAVLALLAAIAGS